MYNGYRYINAGTIEVNKYGKKARAFVERHMEANESGFYSIPAESKYVVIGTSEGRYGEFAKYGDTFLSVNRGGYVWAKVGTPKAEAYLEMLNDIIERMKMTDEARLRHADEVWNQKYEEQYGESAE